MPATRINTEILDQPHQMLAEGTSSTEPTLQEINELLLAENWIARGVSIWYDSLQRLWRWDCSIEKCK